MGYVLLILGIIFLLLPFIITIFNLINLFKKKKIKPILFDVLTFGLGIFLTIILYIFSGFQDYQEQLNITQLDLGLHAPIASWSMPTILAILIVGIISYIIIRNKKLDLPPLLVVICMSGIILCSIFSIIWIIQIWKNLMNQGNIYFIIFPINYIICGLSASIDIIRYYKEKEIKIKTYNNKFLDKCNKIICNINNWPLLAIIFCVPLLLIIMIILASLYIYIC